MSQKLMKTTHSLEINEMLMEELNLNVSGYSLWKELKRQGNLMNQDRMGSERGYTAATRYVRAMQTAIIVEANNENSRAEFLEFEGIQFKAGRFTVDPVELSYNFPSKTFFDEVMRYIADDLEIFPTGTNLLNPEFSGFITNSLYNRFNTD